ncbi:hypothetical protein ABIF50_005877 [Bradyrhizobium diazoefficiens]
MINKANGAEDHLEMTQSFDDTPPLEHVKPALAVLLAGLVGPPAAEGGDEAKKKTPDPKADPSISP